MIYGKVSRAKAVIVRDLGMSGEQLLTLAKEGYGIMGIIDRRRHPQARRTDLRRGQAAISQCHKNHLPLDNIIPFEEVNQQIWQMGAECSSQRLDLGW